MEFSVFDEIQGSFYTARIKPATFYPPHLIEPSCPAACTHFVSFFWGIFQVNFNTKVLQSNFSHLMWVYSPLQKVLRGAELD